MNYNDYDSNGKKRSINFTDMVTDKKQRSRLILGFYIIVILVLIVIVRVNNHSTNSEIKKNEIKKEQESIETKNEELDEMFSLINEDNYEFIYKLNYDEEEYITKGKRYNNKFSFTFEKIGEIPIEFLGTKNYIKAMVEGEEQKAGLPYMYLNYFDNDLLKSLINKANKIDENIYEITNKEMSYLISDLKNIESEKINTIVLIVKNNKITGMEIDYSSAVSELLDKEINMVVKIDYQNFNLVDDFNINFE